jgi:predicted N-acyltransferase
LVAAAPGYLKDNSHGEFVFDHAWANAYARYGLDYYPKWLIGIPYTPVTGPRLLAADDDLRRRLLDGMIAEATRNQWSSVHVNFPPERESGAFPPKWLARCDVQFHWRNRGWKDFPEFLAALQPKKRKNIRQERAKVRDAGYRFHQLHGDELGETELLAMYAFYTRTFDAYGNAAALTLDFFRHLADTMPKQLLIILAEREGSIRAGALFLRGGDTLYGRYWGSDEQSPGLHFETCYYQGIDYCLREGLTSFEPGAQGEHKIARGFLPTPTHSRHWIADARFHPALQTWCAAEQAAQAEYALHLQQAVPYA